MNAYCRSATALALSLPWLTLGPSTARSQVIIPPSPTTVDAFGPARPAHAGSSERSASGIAAVLSQDEPLFQRGQIGVRPHLEARVLYVDGLEAAPGNALDSFIESVAPGVRFDLGKCCSLDYTPTWTYYSNAAFRDTFDQLASLTGRVLHDRGYLGATESYESSTLMLVETGRQTRQERSSTLVEGTYRLGRHTMIEASASRTTRSAAAVVDAPEWTASDWVQWSAMSWLRYEISPRLDLGVGLSAGYAEIGVGADMSSIQPQAKIAWIPADKISLALQVGEERRRVKSGARDTQRSPVYTASAAYQFLPTTRFTVDAVRSVSASYFANEITRSNGWTLGVEQRLIQKLYLAAGVSEFHTRYVSTRAGLAVRREDRYRVLNVRLTVLMLHRIAIAATYLAARNSTDEAGYGFRSHQYGLEASLRF